MALQKIHDISGHLPFLSFGFGVQIPTYFLVSSIAFIISLFYLVRRAYEKDMPRNLATESSIVLMLGGLLGARLFHVIFEEPEYYAASPMRIIEFWRGGFVWYGGVIAGAFAALTFIKSRGGHLWIWLDLYAPVVALGYGLGRIACLLTGCCFGEVCELPNHTLWRHPTQGYAVVFEFLVLFVLLRIERRRRQPMVPMAWRPPGQVFLAWVMLHAIGRIIMETFRADPRGPAVFGVSVATAISIVALCIGAGAFLWRRHLYKHF